VEIADFADGTNCRDVFLASIFLAYVEPTLYFPHKLKNSPVQPLLKPNLVWLLCPPIHWKPSKLKTPLLSLFLFFVALFDPRKRRVNVLPHTFRPVASPLQLPPPTANTAFLDLPFLTIFVGVIVYADKRTGWIQYDLLD
jgi:hypothetical protein